MNNDQMTPADLALEEAKIQKLQIGTIVKRLFQRELENIVKK